MTKFDKILQEKGKTAYDIARAMGKYAGYNNIRKLRDGETFFSECDYPTVSLISRFLEVRPEDLMEEVDINGTTTDINYTNSIKKRLKKKLKEIDTDTYMKFVSVHKKPHLIWVVEEDDGTSEIIFIEINDDGTYTSYRAVYTYAPGIREIAFYKTISETKLFESKEENVSKDSISEDANIKETPIFVNPVLFFDPQKTSKIPNSEETPLNSEPSLNLVDQFMEDSFNNIKRIVDDESLMEPGEKIDYFEFVSKVNPIMYALGIR